MKMGMIMSKLAVCAMISCAAVCAVTAADRTDSVLRFNGAARMRVEQAGLWPSLTGDLTLTAWVSPGGIPAAGGYYAVAGRGWLGNVTGFGLLMSSAGTATFQTRVTATAASAAAPFPFDGRWHHLAGVRDGNETRLYIDGVLAASTTQVLASLYNATDCFTVGQTSSGAYGFNGNIAEVQLWGRALSGTEIGDVMFQGLDGTEAGLLGYWPLGEGSGTVAQDKTAAGNNGTITANPAWGSDFFLSLALAMPGDGWLGWWPLTVADPVSGDTSVSSTATVDVKAFPVPPPGADAYSVGNGAWTPVTALPATLTLDALQWGGWATQRVWFTNTLASVPLRRSAARIYYSPHGYEPAVFLSPAASRVEMAQNLWPNLTSLTLQAWVKVRSLPPSGGSGAIAGRGYLTAVNGFGLHLYPDGNVIFQTRTGNTVILLATAPLPRDGNWHHLTGVRDASVNETRLYIDGVLAATTNGVHSSLYTAGVVFGIGQRHASNTWTFQFDGSVAEVRMWDVARTATEIQGDMRYRLAGDEPGLIGYWPLDEGTGTTARDLSPNPHHGTFAGAAVWELTFDQMLKRPSPVPLGTVIIVK